MLRISSSIRLLGRAFFMVAVLASAGALTQAQELRTVAPHRHAPASLHRMRDDGTADSYNWSGYVVTGTTGSVTSVSGSWTIPASTCSRGSAAEYASFWVGIDGWSSATVEQIGTDSDCSNGTPSYYAWYEFYPENAYYAGNLRNLKPGDNMTATVSYNAATGDFTAKITDTTEAMTFTVTYVPTRRTGTPRRSSAEWITEAPCCSQNGAPLPLADFGTVSYIDDVATVNSHSGPIAYFLGSYTLAASPTVYICTMLSEKTGQIMALPSSFDDPNSGYDFHVTWENVGP